MGFPVYYTEHTKDGDNLFESIGELVVFIIKGPQLYSYTDMLYFNLNGITTTQYILVE